ncbi:MAG: DinB family protein [Blastocatellia bacterium]
MNTTDIRMLHEYTIWANQRMLDAIDQLGVADQQRENGISHGSIHGTALHMLFGEWVWLARWKGNSPAAPLPAADYPDIAAIRAHWRQVENERADFIATLTDEALQAGCAYAAINGDRFTNPLGLLMQHCFNHATLHRGQVVGMIRQLGVTPPQTDFLFFFRK